MVCYETWIDSFSVSIQVAFKGDTQNWVLTGVYGPCGGTMLDEFLGELEEVCSRR